MPRVQGDVKTLYAIKCTATASMRAQKYEVKAHLCQETGVVLFADCNCKSSAGGVCKHVAAALYQLVDYKLSGVNSVPDDKTCTDVLQQWNIPGEGKNKEAVKFENLAFEKANLDRDLKKKVKKADCARTKRFLCYSHFCKKWTILPETPRTSGQSKRTGSR